MSVQKNRPLNEIDARLKKLFPSGMIDGIQLKLELVCGFELFGSYENWANGYQLTVPEREPRPTMYLPKDKLGQREIKVQAGRLDDAVTYLEQAISRLIECPGCGYLFDKKYECCKVCSVCGLGEKGP